LGGSWAWGGPGASWPSWKSSNTTRALLILLGPVAIAGLAPLLEPNADRDSACRCSLNLLAQFSLGRPRIGVCNRVAHLPARRVGFGSLGHQKALPPSFLLFSGLWSSRSALYARFSPPSKGGGLLFATFGVSASL